MKYNIELMRFVAVVLITFTHIRHDFSDGLIYIVLEEIPRIGTVMLSIISGYLFYEISSKNKNLLSKKVKSLLIPYLIANLLVIVPVVITNYFGYNFLNRLSYDYTLITEGLFSLHSPPVNPPTFFVRDLFVVFLLISLVWHRNLKTLIVLIPLLIFGKLMLRFDILFLFIAGAGYSYYKDRFSRMSISLVLISISLIMFFFDFEVYYIRHLMSFLLFINIVHFEINFYKVGGYTYLLHLYHSPIIVVFFPLISIYIDDPYLKVVLQIIAAIMLTYALFLLLRNSRLKKYISGGR